MYRSVAAVLFVVLATGVSSSRAESRRWEAPKISDPVVVDGIMNDTAWGSVPWTESFILYGTLDEPTTTRTRVKIAWDEEHLYVGVEAMDRDIWSVHVDRDDDLWEQDVVELFIDPEGDADGYAEFEISPRNVVLDLWLEKPLFSQGGPSHSDWNAAGLRTAVYIEGTLGGGNRSAAERQDEDVRWTTELALPWADLAVVAGRMSLPPNPGDTWRINVTRYDYSGGDRELSQWSPSDARGAWHEPSEYGYVTFAGPGAGTSVSALSWGWLKQRFR